MADNASEEHRFAPITPDNHSGSIWIATLLCLVYSFITISTRAWLRQKMYSIDDLLLVLALLFQLGCAISTILALNHGLGQTHALLATPSIRSASTSTFAAQLLFILSAAAAKCSTLWLMMRLFNLSGRTSQTKHHGSPRLYLRICYVILAIMALWGLLGIIATTVSCNPSTFILTPSEADCPSQSLRWKIISSTDIATELILILTAVAIVFPVHLAWHLKLQVVLAFVLRVPLIALAALRMHYVDRYTEAENAGLAQTPIVVLEHAYLSWSIISATIPLAKSFIKSFSSGFGIGVSMDTYTSAYGSQKSRQKSYELGSVAAQGGGGLKAGGAGESQMQNGSMVSKERSQDGPEDEDLVTPVRSVRTGEAVVRNHSLPRSRHGEKSGLDGPGEASSMESVRSDKHIIRKDVQWHVGYEARAI